MDIMARKTKRGRPPLGPSALSARLSLRLTPALETDLERAAKLTQRHVHDFVREVIAASVAQVLATAKP